ncbi:MAG TPA: RDD family protein, partial [Bryobacteraceae bacterium]
AQQLIGKLAGAFPKFAEDVGDAFSILVLFVIASVYPMACEWFWRGQTVGKRLFRLRVIDATGLRLEPSQVIIRNLLRYVDVLPICYLVGCVTSLLTQRMQRLGDLAAGTVVVRSVQLKQPDLDQLLGARFNSLLELRHLAARLRQRVPPEIASIALDALIRRGQLEPDARVALFRDLAAYFRKAVEYPPEVAEQLADEQYVRDVVEILFRANL